MSRRGKADMTGSKRQRERDRLERKLEKLRRQKVSMQEKIAEREQRLQ